MKNVLIFIGCLSLAGCATYNQQFPFDEQNCQEVRTKYLQWNSNIKTNSTNAQIINAKAWEERTLGDIATSTARSYYPTGSGYYNSNVYMIKPEYEIVAKKCQWCKDNETNFITSEEEQNAYVIIQKQSFWEAVKELQGAKKQADYDAESRAKCQANPDCVQREKNIKKIYEAQAKQFDRFVKAAKTADIDTLQQMQQEAIEADRKYKYGF